MIDERSLIEKAADQLFSEEPAASEPAQEKTADIVTRSVQADAVAPAQRQERPERREPIVASDAPAGAPMDDGERTAVKMNVDFNALEERGYLTPFKMDTSLAEEFRLLKRPLLREAFSGTNHHRNVIMVTSAKPREGKTFVSTNMAISIASEKDVHVLLVEADAMRPSVMAAFGLPPNRPGLLDVLDDPTLDISDVIVRTNIGKLSVIPAGRDKAVAPELLSSDQMRELAEELANRYPDRIIIFDTPPLLAATEPSVLAQHAGQVLFVVEAGRTSEIAAKSALELIHDHPRVVMMLNKVHPLFDLGHFGRGNYYYYGYGQKKDSPPGVSGFFRNMMSNLPWSKAEGPKGRDV